MEALGEGGFRIEQHLAIIEHRAGTLEPTAITTQHPACHVEAVVAVEASGEVGVRDTRAHIRNGKIARLHKLERDMVNRMLHNHVPYSKIVGALEELRIKVTERNVSNWGTRGGYKEWCAEQERQLHLSRLQDNLTDCLRKNDAGQLPEVGLQVAATQLSLMLLQPEAIRYRTNSPCSPHSSTRACRKLHS